MAGLRIASALILVLLTAVTSALAQEPPRVNVWIYRYGGLSHSVENEHAFENFLDMVQDRLITLSDELVSLGGDLGYLRSLKRIRVTRGGKFIEFNGSSEDLRDQWMQLQTLAVLEGQIRGQPPKFLIRSHIFIGDLKGALLKEDVVVDLKFDIQDFQPASDTHAVAIIYALAMDAEHRGLRHDVVIQLLNKAKVYADGIDNHLSGATDLKTAINKSLTALRAIP